MANDKYEREYNLNFGKNYYLYLLILFPILYGALISKNNLSVNQTLIFVLIVLFIATVLGYGFAYKKVLFAYSDNQISIIFAGGFFGLRNKKYLINLAQIEEYKEREIGKGCGYMQFYMKDSSVIEIAYSPYVDTYVNLRSEILDVLKDNNVKRTCIL